MLYSNGVEQKTYQRPDDVLTLNDLCTHIQVGDKIQTWHRGKKQTVLTILGFEFGTPSDRLSVRIQGRYQYGLANGEKRIFETHYYATDLGIAPYKDNHWNWTNWCTKYVQEEQCYKVVSPTLQSLHSHQGAGQQYKVGEWVEDRFDNGFWCFETRDDVEEFLTAYGYDGFPIFEAIGKEECDCHFLSPGTIRVQDGKIEGDTHSFSIKPNGSKTYKRVKLTKFVGYSRAKTTGKDKSFVWTH